MVRSARQSAERDHSVLPDHGENSIRVVISNPIMHDSVPWEASIRLLGLETKSISWGSHRTVEGRDRTAARTTLGGEFPTLALSIREVGTSFPHGPRFRRPPYDPGRWAFPSPVLTLASLRLPSQRARSLSADPPTPLHALVGCHGRSLVHRPYNVRGLLELPSAQSPLARARCDRSRRDLLDHGSRCDPAFIAPTGSCASPPPSSRLGGTLGHQVCAGCCQPLLGRGPARRCLGAAFPACLALSPGGA
jgi:hypothetical protein